MLQRLFDCLAVALREIDVAVAAQQGAPTSDGVLLAEDLSMLRGLMLSRPGEGHRGCPEGRPRSAEQAADAHVEP
ncbi:MAG: hypothetical protein U0R78_05560 [Nocardioidaceae bacterium]